jgi:hypothetical protein
MKEFRTLTQAKRVYTLWVEEEGEMLASWYSEFTLEITSLSGAWIAEIGLWCNNGDNVLTDYDGVYCLSDNTVDALRLLGFDTSEINP